MKTSKNEVTSYLVGSDMTYNCETKISLLPIDWIEEYEPERGAVWYGNTPFGSYSVYERKKRWILNGLDDGAESCNTLEEACNRAQIDYSSRLGEVLGVKVDKARDRIAGSWDSEDDSDL